MRIRLHMKLHRKTLKICLFIVAAFACKTYTCTVLLLKYMLLWTISKRGKCKSFVFQKISYSACTDSDVDGDSKSVQRKSKPENKRRRAKNLGPRVRVMKSTPVEEPEGNITEVRLECHLEIKNEESAGRTLTFEFSYPDGEPEEISLEFVSNQIYFRNYRE